MTDKKNITFKDCTYDKRYKQLGVTPKELFLRQNKKCNLIAAYDKYDNENFFGALYCTDGNEYALTKNMLNPTYECIKCITNFLEKELKQQEMTKKLNKTIVNILIKLGEATSLHEGKTEMYMCKETFNFLEEHLENNTLFSNETNPLKVTASGKILMFGVEVIFIKETEPGTIIIQPGNLLYKI